MRPYVICMRRITFSCSSETSAQLDWLCSKTMRKASNLLSLLIHYEVDRHLDGLPAEERTDILNSIYGHTEST
jgi:hypothetical protein